MRLDVINSQNHFSNSPIDIFGRDDEQEFLEEFLDQEGKGFSWLQIAGDGGQGKSRLAYNLVLKSKNDLDWHAGFIEPPDLKVFADNVADWEPQNKTLIVVDYVLGNVEPVGKIIRGLSERQKFDIPVRLVLLERQRWDKGGLTYDHQPDNSDKTTLGLSSSDGEASWFLQMSEHHGLERELHKRRFKSDNVPKGVVELLKLPPDRLHEIVEELWIKAERTADTLPLTENKIKSELARIDKEGRPLYAFFFAQALIVGDYKEGTSLVGLLQNTLERERDTRWRKTFSGEGAPDLSDEALHSKIAVVATMAGGYQRRAINLPKDWGSPEGETIKRACVITDTPQGSNEQEKNTVLALNPDILGEWFVLCSLNNTSPDEVKKIVQTAWLVNPENMATFLLHCTQDFAKHPSGIVVRLLQIELPGDKARSALQSVAVDIFSKLYTKDRTDYPENIITGIKTASDADQPRAQTAFGFCLLKGVSVKRDLKEGAKLFKSAVDAGDTGAMFNLAVCYKNGDGVKKNLQKAVELYQQAVDAGHLAAMNNLAVCYGNGDGVKKNLQKAVELYQQAVDAGDAGAMFNLADCYKDGDGVKKNLLKVVELLQQAVDAGDAGAMVNLAVCYGNGDGVKKNLQKAVELYQQAVDAGEAMAMNNLAVCYGNGDGVEKDMQKAVELLQQAADAGHAGATKFIQCFPDQPVNIDTNVASSLVKAIVANFKWPMPPLLPTDWHDVYDREAQPLLEKLLRFSHLGIGKKAIPQALRSCNLECYPTLTLTEVLVNSHGQENIICLLSNGKDAFLLNGTSGIVNYLAQTNYLSLPDAKTSTEYLRFFSKVVCAEHGHFKIIENFGDLEFAVTESTIPNPLKDKIKPVTLIEETAEASKFSAIFQHGNTIFNADFLVQYSENHGIVGPLDADPIAEDLPLMVGGFEGVYRYWKPYSEIEGLAKK